MRDDLVRDLVRRVLEMHPEIPMAKLLELELSLRRQYGGRNFYVKKRPTDEPEHAPKR
jgi:hypothetical protein